MLRKACPTLEDATAKGVTVVNFTVSASSRGCLARLACVSAPAVSMTSERKLNKSGRTRSEVWQRPCAKAVIAKRITVARTIASATEQVSPVIKACATAPSASITTTLPLCLPQLPMRAPKSRSSVARWKKENRFLFLRVRKSKARCPQTITDDPQKQQIRTSNEPYTHSLRHLAC